MLRSSWDDRSVGSCAGALDGANVARDCRSTCPVAEGVHPLGTSRYALVAVDVATCSWPRHERRRCEHQRWSTLVASRRFRCPRSRNSGASSLTSRAAALADRLAARRASSRRSGEAPPSAARSSSAPSAASSFRRIRRRAGLGSPRAHPRRARRRTQADATEAGDGVSANNGLVQKLWGYANVLRDDGLSYGDYLEQLTYLLFLKMADEQTKPPFNGERDRARGLRLAVAARARRRRARDPLPARPRGARQEVRDARRRLPQGAEQDPEPGACCGG